MKKVYLFIIMATFCMPVVFAQSIFRGKTVKSEELKLTYSVDENDNAKMLLEQSGSGASMITEVMGKDLSTKKLFFFEKDLSTTRLVEVRAHGFTIHSDGYAILQGERIDKENHPDIWQKCEQVFNQFNEMILETVEGKENTSKFQIAYIDNEIFLCPNASLIEKGRLDQSMEYSKFTIEDNPE